MAIVGKLVLARGMRSFGLALAFSAMSFGGSAETVRPVEPDELVNTIRTAIETKDYDAFQDLVFWKDAGKIKKRIIRYQINRGLGRPVKSITFEEVSDELLDGVNATGKLSANMDISNRVRVVYDEAPINSSGKLPTSVFLVGKVRGEYRIALVVRNSDFDDDDD